MSSYYCLLFRGHFCVRNLKTITFYRNLVECLILDRVGLDEFLAFFHKGVSWPVAFQELCSYGQYVKFKEFNLFELIAVPSKMNLL